MTIEDRTAYLTDHLTAALKSVGAHAAVVDLETFQAWPLQPQYRFGILAPVISDDQRVIAAFCPALLAASAAEYDDDTFEVYVETLGMAILQDISMLVEHPDGDVRRQLAIDFLAETAPEHYRLITGAQLHAMDVELVKAAGPVD